MRVATEACQVERLEEGAKRETFALSADAENPHRQMYVNLIQSYIPQVYRLSALLMWPRDVSMVEGRVDICVGVVSIVGSDIELLAFVSLGLFSHEALRDENVLGRLSKFPSTFDYVLKLSSITRPKLLLVHPKPGFRLSFLIYINSKLTKHFHRRPQITISNPELPDLADGIYFKLHFVALFPFVVSLSKLRLRNNNKN